MLFFSLVDDVVITSKDEAKDMQKIIEKMCRKKLGFDLRSGDIVLGQFANLPNVEKVSRPTSSSAVHVLLFWFYLDFILILS